MLIFPALPLAEVFNQQWNERKAILKLTNEHPAKVFSSLVSSIHPGQVVPSPIYLPPHSTFPHCTISSNRFTLMFPQRDALSTLNSHHIRSVSPSSRLFLLLNAVSERLISPARMQALGRQDQPPYFLRCYQKRQALNRKNESLLRQ